MNILLCNPPWNDSHVDDGWFGVRAGSRWPHKKNYLVGTYIPFPFYLATSYTILKREGFNVEILDSIASGQTYEEFYNQVKLNNYDIVVMETSTPSLKNDLAIAERIKQIKRNDVKIVFCGIHEELSSVNFLKKNSHVDFTIYGEYELPLLEFFKAENECNDYSKVHNITYRKNKTEVIKNERKVLCNFDELSWPEREMLPKTYSDNFGGLQSPQLQIHTSRGCPFGCIFCAWPQIMYGGNCYRKRNPQDVVDEILYNLEKYPYKSINIDDDTFNVDKKHVMELCRLFKENKLNGIQWGAMGRADIMDEEMLLALKEAGLYAIKYGVESFDENVLYGISKSMNLEKNIENILLTKKLGIKVHLTFCLGLPGDTEETIKNTIDKAMELPFDTVQFSIATPYPGCKLYDLYDKKGWIITKDWDNYNGTGVSTIQTETLSAEKLEFYYNYAIQKTKEKYFCEKAKLDEIKLSLQKEICEEQESILVFHSVFSYLTKYIINELINLGKNVSVLTSSKNKEEFCDILEENRIISFESPAFDKEIIKELLDTLDKKNEFDFICIPNIGESNATYKNVFDAAKLFNAKIIKISEKGKISFGLN